MDDLKSLIREVPDFPKPGSNFYDITTLLKHPDGLRKTVDALAAQYNADKIDTVIGVEARASYLPRRLLISNSQSAATIASALSAHCPTAHRALVHPHTNSTLSQRTIS